MDEGEEMYSMSVKLASNHKTNDKISILEKRSDSATVCKDGMGNADNKDHHHHHSHHHHHHHHQVSVGDEIHVSSHINAVPYLALSMEQVWLTHTPSILFWHM